jgi:ribonuclease HI
MLYTIFCDGGSLGNNDKTKPSEGYGSFIIKPEIMERRFMQRFASYTNNEAEYAALIAALDYLKSECEVRGINNREQDVLVRTDSQLVIGQLSKNWKVKAANLMPFIIRAQDKMHWFKSVTFNHISGVEMKKILGH